MVSVFRGLEERYIFYQPTELFKLKRKHCNSLLKPSPNFLLLKCRCILTLPECGQKLLEERTSSCVPAFCYLWNFSLTHRIPWNTAGWRRHLCLGKLLLISWLSVTLLRSAVGKHVSVKELLQMGESEAKNTILWISMAFHLPGCVMAA